MLAKYCQVERWTSYAASASFRSPSCRDGLRVKLDDAALWGRVLQHASGHKRSHVQLCIREQCWHLLFVGEYPSEYSQYLSWEFGRRNRDEKGGVKLFNVLFLQRIKFFSKKLVVLLSLLWSCACIQWSEQTENDRFYWTFDITTKQRERTHQRQRLHQREELHQRIRSVLVWVSFFLLFCITLLVSCLMRFHICS